MNQASNFIPYNSNYFRNRRTDLSQRISSTDALFGFIKEIKESGVLLPDEISLEDFRIRTDREAKWILNKLNTPQSIYNSLRAVQSDGQYWQTWDFVPSNLGKGFLFYFVCDGCDRRVKYLYNPDGQNRFLCRICHRVAYPRAK
ncbi:MAG: hypothetical protein WCI79_00085 [Candidatus Saccharibacteria bacterium]